MKHTYLAKDFITHHRLTCKDTGGIWFLGLMMYEGDITIQICTSISDPPLALPTSLESHQASMGLKHLHQYEESYEFGFKQDESDKIVIQ